MNILVPLKRRPLIEENVAALTRVRFEEAGNPILHAGECRQRAVPRRADH